MQMNAKVCKRNQKCTNASESAQTQAKVCEGEQIFYIKPKTI